MKKKIVIVHSQQYPGQREIHEYNWWFRLSGQSSSTYLSCYNDCNDKEVERERKEEAIEVAKFKLRDKRTVIVEIIEVEIV